MSWNPLVARISHLTPKKEHGGTVGLFRAGNALVLGLTTIGAGYLANIYGIKSILFGASIFALFAGLTVMFMSKGIIENGGLLLEKHHLIHLHDAHQSQQKN